MVIDAILDTSIIIDLLKGNQNAVAWHASLGSQILAITPIVWVETLQGAQNKARQANFIRFLTHFQLEHPTSRDNLWAMAQFAQFYLSHQIGYDDISIASVAVRLSIPLYTLNIRHYAPLPNVDERKPY